MAVYMGFRKDGHHDGEVCTVEEYKQKLVDMHDNVLSNHHRIAIAVINDTDQDLRLVADAFAVGRWHARPPFLIPKQHVGVMGVQNRDNEPHGVKGFVLYEGLDFAILCAFDKPYVGTLKSLGLVRDRGCWTYFDGEIQVAAGVLDHVLGEVEPKGGTTFHTTRTGTAQYQIAYRDHNDPSVAKGHLEFAVSKASGAVSPLGPPDQPNLASPQLKVQPVSPSS
eukprot:EG_transcript_28099